MKPTFCESQRTDAGGGFGLIELIVVVLVISIVAGYGLNYLGGWAVKRKFEEGLDRTEQALKFARYKAILEREKVSLTFDGEKIFYEFDDRRRTLLFLSGFDFSSKSTSLNYYPGGNSSSGSLWIRFEGYAKRFRLSHNAGIRRTDQ